jgi:hypothetical protein
MKKGVFRGPLAFVCGAALALIAFGFATSLHGASLLPNLQALDNPANLVAVAFWLSTLLAAACFVAAIPRRSPPVEHIAPQDDDGETWEEILRPLANTLKSAAMRDAASRMTVIDVFDTSAGPVTITWAMYPSAGSLAAAYGNKAKLDERKAYVSAQLKKVLHGNPNAALQQHAKTLGIIVEHVERRGDPPADPVARRVNRILQEIQRDAKSVKDIDEGWLRIKGHPDFQAWFADPKNRDVVRQFEARLNQEKSRLAFPDQE